VATRLGRIAHKARREPALRFNNLYSLLSAELLRGCFAGLRGDAASGIDEVTKAQYAEHLDANLLDLEERLHRMAYRPQAVRRVYIPKPGSGKLRPLGIPALEDKLVQAALVRILECIYEGDFVKDSYGFRPSRSCHEALRALSREVESGWVEWVVEADIRSFFDTVEHDWLMTFLAHRVADTRLLRLIKRFLKAGVLEDGTVHAAAEGTPQGGVISPLLANVYLHYALDLWFVRRHAKGCAGRARLIRYADDFVACFEYEADAHRYRREVEERLGRFGLGVEPTKTKVLAFGPSATYRARRAGRRKPETFDFLGFTHYCSRSRTGRRFRMKRCTARKKFRAKLQALEAWLRRQRAVCRTRDIWKAFQQKLEGHFRYYGVTDNYRALVRFAHAAERLLFKWLNRRGGKHRLTWAKYRRLARLFPFPQPRIHVDLFASPAAEPSQGYLFPG
jgi:group II intron reverse transcriptase/maturase